MWTGFVAASSFRTSGNQPWSGVKRPDRASCRDGDLYVARRRHPPVRTHPADGMQQLVGTKVLDDDTSKHGQACKLDFPILCA